METSEAILIDPVYEQASRDQELLYELGLKLRYTLEHKFMQIISLVHGDFIKALKEKIALSGNIGSNGLHRTRAHGDKNNFGNRFLTVRETPGHTAGCLTFVLDNEKMAFTGDCLLIRGYGRTDFQGGNAAEMYRFIHNDIIHTARRLHLVPGPRL